MAIKQIFSSLPYQDPTGAALAGGLLTLDLSQPATATGSGEVAPLRVDVILNSTGKFSATNLWANDQLLPAGTTYRLQVYNANGLLVADFGALSIVGASPIDISLLVPVSGGGGTGFVTAAVLLNPSTSQTVNQPTGTSLFVNRFENVRYADEFTGATADLKIIAALADLPAGGGTVDCHGFGGSVQVIASTVTVGANQTLLFDQATQFQPATAALNMFSQLEGSIIDGCFVDTTNLTYTGSVFNFLNYLTDNSHTYLRNIRIHAASQTTGTGITLKPPSGNTSAGLAFLSISHVRIQGMLNGFLIDGNGGFINGNHFEDIHVSQAVHGYNFNNTGTGAILANHFVNISYQTGPSTVEGIRMASPGTGTISENIFSPVNIWDAITAINQTDAFESSNRYVGHWDGAVVDFELSSSFDKLQSATFVGPFTFNQLLTAASGVVSGGNGGTDTFRSVQTTTNSVQMHLVSTGGALFVGIDNSAGSAFSSGAYVSNWFSPANNSAFTTPVASFSGQITQNAGLTVTSTVASGTAAMTTALIAGGAIGTTVSVVATGALATDTIVFCFNAAVTANPGVLIINAWPTSGHVNFQYANPTAAGVTPTAATLNWKVVR